MIRVEGVTIRYDELVAVREVSLQVQEGWVFGLIGPNGAGKTSLLRALAGLLLPDGGTCRIRGLEVATEAAAVHRLIGYMPDFFGVYDSLRVWEYLEFFGQVHDLGSGRLAERTDAVLALTDLEFKRDTLVGGLSRGMKQRLCLARALLHDPPVLLLDEPASGVDPGGRYELRRIIRGLGEAGKTVLVSSHILPELADVCDSVGIMERGTLLVSGALSEVTARLEGGRRVRLRVLDGRAGEAPALLEGLAGVRQAEAREAEVTLQLDDREETFAAVLTRLVTAGLRLGAVATEERDLERLYLQLTHGELA